LPLDWTAASPAEVEAAGERIAALAAELRPDIVHLNSPALASAGRFRAPVVGICHSCVATWWEAASSGPLPPDLAWRRDLLARGYRAVDALAAPSAAFAQATARMYGLRHAPLVIYNGRRSTSPSKARTAAKPFAFTAGRLWDKGKNLAALDRAAARIAIPVLAAGPQHGPNHDSIALAAVTALGRLSESQIQDHLADKPILVSVALYEPFGLAVLEAAQKGCALVLSDIPTFRELWDDAAIFVPAYDDVSIAAAIETLANDAPLRARLGDAAQERSGRYTVEAMAAGVMDLYGSLLQGRAAPARRPHEVRLLHPLAGLLLEPRQRAFSARRLARADCARASGHRLRAGQRLEPAEPPGRPRRCRARSVSVRLSGARLLDLSTISSMSKVRSRMPTWSSCMNGTSPGSSPRSARNAGAARATPSCSTTRTTAL
jgi:glycosyltransferase involved in cell wall biosynthesis